MNNIFTLIFLSLFLISCSEAEQSSKEGKGFTVIDPDEVIEPGDQNWISVPNIYTAKNFACTATLIGKDTLITAAHCVDKNNKTGPAETVEVMFRLDDNFHIFECTMTPEYRNGAYKERGFRSSFDVALCKSLNPDRLPSYINYENVDLTTKRTSKTQFYFAGYGCFYEANGAFNSGDGKLRIGASEIGELINTERQFYEQFGYFRTLTNRNDEQGDICQGDSGGPTFNVDDKLIAIVSGGAKTRTGEQLSRFVDVSHPTNADFILDWLSNNNDSYICGVSDRIGSVAHKNAGCRTSSR